MRPGGVIGVLILLSDVSHSVSFESGDIPLSSPLLKTVSAPSVS